MDKFRINRKYTSTSSMSNLVIDKLRLPSKSKLHPVKHLKVASVANSPSQRYSNKENVPHQNSIKSSTRKNFLIKTKKEKVSAFVPL